MCVSILVYAISCIFACVIHECMHAIACSMCWKVRESRPERGTHRGGVVASRELLYLGFAALGDGHREEILVHAAVEIKNVQNLRVYVYVSACIDECMLMHV